MLEQKDKRLGLSKGLSERGMGKGEGEEGGQEATLQQGLYRRLIKTVPMAEIYHRAENGQMVNSGFLLYKVMSNIHYRWCVIVIAGRQVPLSAPGVQLLYYSTFQSERETDTPN